MPQKLTKIQNFMSNGHKFRLDKVSHPSEIVKELYLDEINYTITQLSKNLGVTRTHMSNFLNGKVDVSVEFAVRLAKALNTTPALWLNMQLSYNLRQLEDNPQKLQTILDSVTKIKFPKLAEDDVK
jgi:antitoxin HigA-1